MSSKLPPQPTGSPPGSSFWNDWYEKIRQIINNNQIVTLFTNLDFSGSNINQIQTRPHNSLQSIQGGAVGDYYHLTNVQYTDLTDGGDTTLHTHSGIGNLVLYSLAADPTTTDIVAGTSKLYKNTTSGLVKLWVNDGGILKSVLLS